MSCRSSSTCCRGTMSLVGPRPCLAYETEYFAAHHYERFLAPAGITGLWQVTARAHASFAEALEMDVGTFATGRSALDLSLIFRTPDRDAATAEVDGLMAPAKQVIGAEQQRRSRHAQSRQRRRRCASEWSDSATGDRTWFATSTSRVRAEAAWMCDLRPEVLEVLGRRFPAVRQTRDFDEMLDDDSLDAVAVVTPVSTHHDLAMRALNAGKHVFVEKPLAVIVGRGHRPDPRGRRARPRAHAGSYVPVQPAGQPHSRPDPAPGSSERSISSRCPGSISACTSPT